MMSLILFIEGVFVLRKISCKVPLFITSVTSNVGRISSELLLFLVLLFVVMVVLLLFVVSSCVDCESLIFSCSHLLFSSYESSFFFFPESVESKHFLLAHIPRMNESRDPGRPFKEAITTSVFFTSSFTASSCSLI